jgi:hypothetical protein
VEVVILNLHRHRFPLVPLDKSFLDIRQTCTNHLISSFNSSSSSNSTAIRSSNTCNTNSNSDHSNGLEVDMILPISSILAVLLHNNHISTNPSLLDTITHPLPLNTLGSTLDMAMTLLHIIIRPRISPNFTPRPHVVNHHSSSISGLMHLTQRQPGNKTPMMLSKCLSSLFLYFFLFFFFRVLTNFSSELALWCFLISQHSFNHTNSSFFFTINLLPSPCWVLLKR